MAFSKGSFFDFFSLFGHKDQMIQKTSNATQKIQDKILTEALKDIPFDGLSWDVIVRAGEKVGYDADVVASVFTDKITDFLKYFSSWADAQMLATLAETDLEAMKIRDRVRHGVWARLMVLAPHREVVRASVTYWANPLRKASALKMIWGTSDAIWKWAGDNSADYNKYTKRGLLSGVITATTLAWLNDKSEDYQKTAQFLDRRIDNVLVVGRLAGKIIGKAGFAKKG